MLKSPSSDALALVKCYSQLYFVSFLIPRVTQAVQRSHIRNHVYVRTTWPNMKKYELRGHVYVRTTWPRMYSFCVLIRTTWPIKYAYELCDQVASQTFLSFQTGEATPIVHNSRRFPAHRPSGLIPSVPGCSHSLTAHSSSPFIDARVRFPSERPQVKRQRGKKKMKEAYRGTLSSRRIPFCSLWSSPWAGGSGVWGIPRRCVLSLYVFVHVSDLTSRP